MIQHDRVNDTPPGHEEPQEETVFVLYDPKAKRYLFEQFPQKHGTTFIRGATFFVHRETAEKRLGGRWTEVVVVNLVPLLALSDADRICKHCGERKGNHYAGLRPWCYMPGDTTKPETFFEPLDATD